MPELISRIEIEQSLHRLRRKKRWLRGLVCLGFCLCAACVWLFTSSRVYVVQGLSMQPTLFEGDVLKYSRFHAPAYGDVVVFNSEYGMLVKRVIGIAGDRIAVSPDGTVTRNGEPVDEPYIQKDGFNNSQMAEITVEADRLFVMGDNRGQSVDSRDPRIGQIPLSAIDGRIIESLRQIGAE